MVVINSWVAPIAPSLRFPLLPTIRNSAGSPCGSFSFSLQISKVARQLTPNFRAYRQLGKYRQHILWRRSALTRNVLTSRIARTGVTAFRQLRGFYNQTLTLVVRRPCYINSIAIRIAAIRLDSLALPVQAISMAVPWSTDVRTMGNPRVTLTASSNASAFSGINPWS